MKKKIALNTLNLEFLLKKIIFYEKSFDIDIYWNKTGQEIFII